MRLDKLRRLLRQNDEDRLRNFLGGVRMTDAAQRDGINEIHVPLDERGERRFGTVVGVFRQQGDVVRFGHLPINVRRRGKGNNKIQGTSNIQHPTPNIQSVGKWKSVDVRCWMLVVGCLIRPLPRRDAQRLDVDEHVADGGHFGADFVLHFVGDAVRSFDGHLRVHLHVHVHEKLLAHLADETFFHAAPRREWSRPRRGFAR